MKNLMEQVESKVSDELKDTKSKMEARMAALAERLKQDESSGLESKRNLIKQVQEGIFNMKELIKETKEQNQWLLDKTKEAKG